MDEHRITRVRVSRGASEEEDLAESNSVQESGEGIATEDRDFSTVRFDPAGASNNPRLDPAAKEIASESKGRL